MNLYLFALIDYNQGDVFVADNDNNDVDINKIYGEKRLNFNLNISK